jgi:hypothetical protein
MKRSRTEVLMMQSRNIGIRSSLIEDMRSRIIILDLYFTSRVKLMTRWLNIDALCNLIRNMRTHTLT